MISCHEALAVVYDYLDGELEGVDRAQVQAHFDVCARCYPQLMLEEAFLETVARGRVNAPAPEGLREAVLALLGEADPT